MLRFPQSSTAIRKSANSDPGIAAGIRYANFGPDLGATVARLDPTVREDDQAADAVDLRLQDESIWVRNGGLERADPVVRDELRQDVEVVTVATSW
jgi:hypothetical protein